MQGEDFAELIRIERRLAGLRSSLLAQKLKILEEAGVLHEKDLHGEERIKSTLLVDNQLTQIEEMLNEVQSKWATPRSAAVEAELERMKQGEFADNILLRTGKNGGQYEPRISRGGKFYRKYL